MTSRVCVLLLVVLSYAASPTAMQRAPQGNAPIAVRTATVDGVKLQYLAAGHGPAIVLLHGYAETSLMWRPLIPRLANHFTVIAPDLPGIGGSDIPKDGLDMKSAAVRIHTLVKETGVTSAIVVGHDIGLMVAYAYAAQFPAEVDKLVLMDAFLPGVDGWEAIYNNPTIWHFRFNGPTPEALVTGRERLYFEHFWNDLAADKARSIPEAARQAYTIAYARPGRMRAGWAYFVSFQQAAKDFAQLSRTKLPMPVLSIGGENGNGEALGQQVKLVATRADAVVLAHTGHWLMEENPRETTEALLRFIGSAQTSATSRPTLPAMRLTPEVGSAPRTTIQAHSHRDDRMATVVSGSWQSGTATDSMRRPWKALPAGSVYSEPAGTTHFARTDAEPVLVEISSRPNRHAILRSANTLAGGGRNPVSGG